MHLRRNLDEIGCRRIAIERGHTEIEITRPSLSCGRGREVLSAIRRVLVEDYPQELTVGAGWTFPPLICIVVLICWFLFRVKWISTVFSISNTDPLQAAHRSIRGMSSC
jgi:hypothetical protein